MSEKPKKRLDRNQVMTLGVAAAMLGAFIGLVYVPNSRASSASERRLVERRAELAQKMKETRGLPQVQQEVAALEVEYKRDLARIPSEPKVPEFLRQVADILDAEKISQRSVLPEEQRASNGYVELPVEIGFDAPFGPAWRVLSKLEGLDRISRVEDIQFASVPGVADQVRVVMRVVIFHSGIPLKGVREASAGGRGGRS